MQVKIKKIHNDAILPTRNNSADSGMDVFSIDDVTIPTGKMIPIHTGIAIQLPDPDQFFTYECQVRPRSGLAAKHQITIQNSPGTVDFLYRGEIIVLLRNEGEIAFHVERGMRIAQLVIAPVIIPELIEVAELDDTDRGDKGFGSSGVK